MKELRSVVNACFCFLVFLMVIALFKPGHTRGRTGSPRFLRMEVEERHHGREESRVRLNVPYFFVRGAARFASLGRFHRELDLRWDESLEHEEIQKVWEELKAAEDGKEVVREHGSEVMRFRKEGGTVVLECTKGDDPDERVTLRLPAHLVAAAVESDKDLDVDAILTELQSAQRGDLVDVRDRDAHVRIWVE